MGQMKHRLTILLATCATLIVTHSLLAIGASPDKQLTVMRAGTRPVIEGPAANFTGKATIDRQVRPDASQRIMGSLVSFEPGARTAWHTHPLGQTLIVTSGCGWVQSRRRQERRNPRRRRHLDARERQALAWCAAECGNVPLRHCRTAEWQQRGMDGKGERRAIRQPGSQHMQDNEDINRREVLIIGAATAAAAALPIPASARSVRAPRHPSSPNSRSM